MTIDAEHVARQVEAVRARIAARTDRRVEIVAVTKGFGPDAVAAAAAAGCPTIGENYAQETIAKAAASADAGVRVQFIGRLQTNKVRRLTGLVTTWASVDRPKLADEIATRDPGGCVFIQVDSTGERGRGKGGVAPADVAALVAHCRSLDLNLNGMMTVGPTDGDAARTLAAFRDTRRLVDAFGLAECSMGMTADLDLAVTAGCTQVRLGTLLFGSRPSPVRTGA